MLIQANSLAIPLSDQSVQCCICSPPYWGLRDYGLGEDGIGLEKTIDGYVNSIVEVGREVWRTLKDNGTFWIVLGDSYITSGPKNKNLAGTPWRVALALQEDGWCLRSDIIWHKSNAMPESVKDRPTRAHEYIFLLSKKQRYYYDADAIKEKSLYPNDDRKSRSTMKQKRMPTSSIAGMRPGSATYPYKNRRTVWKVTTQPYKDAHFAVFPPKLVEPMIKAGSPRDGIVLDPFVGSGTTGIVALQLGRRFIGIDLSADYLQLAFSRLYSQPYQQNIFSMGDAWLTS